MRRPVTIGDLCELTGYSRDQMRGLLAELPRFANRPSAARVAQEYSNHDVMVVVLLCRLETLYGLKRGSVAALCEAVAQTIAMPRVVSKRARLLVDLATAQCDYCEDVPKVADGLVVPLEPVFSAIDAYLMPEPLIQREVGLTAVPSSRATQRAKAAAESPARASQSPRRQRSRRRPDHG